MTDWMRNARMNPPPADVVVEIFVEDPTGNYILDAKRVDYKPGSSKKQLKRGWRWCLTDGSTLDVFYVVGWRSKV